MYLVFRKKSYFPFILGGDDITTPKRQNFDEILTSKYIKISRHRARGPYYWSEEVPIKIFNSSLK